MELPDPAPPSEGVSEFVRINGKTVFCELFTVREMNNTFSDYVIIKHPNTEPGVKISVKKIRNATQ